MKRELPVSSIMATRRQTLLTRGKRSRRLSSVQTPRSMASSGMLLISVSTKGCLLPASEMASTSFLRGFNFSSHNCPSSLPCRIAPLRAMQDSHRSWAMRAIFSLSARAETQSSVMTLFFSLLHLVVQFSHM